MQFLREIYLINIIYNYYDQVRLLRLSGQVVRRRSRKPKIAGSNPVWASLLYAFFPFFYWFATNLYIQCSIYILKNKRKKLFICHIRCGYFRNIRILFSSPGLNSARHYELKIYHWSKKINECREFTVLQFHISQN